MATDTAIAVEAFALGASAYLSKSSSATELCRVLHLVAAGGRYLDPAIANSIGALHASHSADPIVRLTPRELEVLKMLVTGMSMKAAARNLGITPRTVAFHKYRAMDILGLNGNSELIDFAVCHGLLNGRTGRFVGR
jgi:DNA-binding NarL/FixJ family response regulator